jgi:hypothetical protein
MGPALNANRDEQTSQMQRGERELFASFRVHDRQFLIARQAPESTANPRHLHSSS